MSDPSQWMDSSKLSLAVLLVRAGCFTDCNPGGYGGMEEGVGVALRCVVGGRGHV